MKAGETDGAEKYQVFISSTFKDLAEERQDTLKSVLDMGHIPSGMEICPAVDIERFDYIKKIIKMNAARLRFDRRRTVRSPKSLMRMFGPDGNPTAENLLGVIGALQEETGVHLKIRAVTEAA